MTHSILVSGLNQVSKDEFLAKAALEKVLFSDVTNVEEMAQHDHVFDHSTFSQLVHAAQRNKRAPEGTVGHSTGTAAATSLDRSKPCLKRVKLVSKMTGIHRTVCHDIVDIVL
eukprot:COSAG05_NODE_689_length_7904_cov_97.607816_8_plen_113_part_00